MNSIFWNEIIHGKILTVTPMSLFVVKNMTGIIPLFASKLFVAIYHF